MFVAKPPDWFVQRLREQIKGWQQLPEAKSQLDSLTEVRKAIEKEMERFKVVEKETKTKAFSKEGLGAATKIDPAVQLRAEARNWLNDSVDQLSQQIDKFEAEIESIGKGAKKKSKPSEVRGCQFTTNADLRAAAV